ncbi:unnamed protein product, partial [Didymodactylos carnosus]
ITHGTTDRGIKSRSHMHTVFNIDDPVKVKGFVTTIEINFSDAPSGALNANLWLYIISRTNVIDRYNIKSSYQIPVNKIAGKTGIQRFPLPEAALMMEAEEFLGVGFGSSSGDCYSVSNRKGMYLNQSSVAHGVHQFVPRNNGIAFSFQTTTTISHGSLTDINHDRANASGKTVFNTADQVKTDGFVASAQMNFYTAPTKDKAEIWLYNIISTKISYKYTIRTKYRIPVDQIKEEPGDQTFIIPKYHFNVTVGSFVGVGLVSADGGELFNGGRSSWMLDKATLNPGTYTFISQTMVGLTFSFTVATFQEMTYGTTKESLSVVIPDDRPIVQFNVLDVPQISGDVTAVQIHFAVAPTAGLAEIYLYIISEGVLPFALIVTQKYRIPVDEIQERTGIQEFVLKRGLKIGPNAHLAVGFERNAGKAYALAGESRFIDIGKASINVGHTNNPNFVPTIKYSISMSYKVTGFKGK